MTSVSIDVIGPFWLAIKREFYGIQGFHTNIKLPMLSSNIFPLVGLNLMVTGSKNLMPDIDCKTKTLISLYSHTLLIPVKSS